MSCQLDCPACITDNTCTYCGYSGEIILSPEEDNVETIICERGKKNVT